MTPAEALAVAQRTLLVLLPEFLIILTAVVMMTAGAFVKLPRRVWSASAALALVAALAALLALRGTATDVYAAVALNDPLSFYARLVFLVTGLIVLGLAHDQVDDGRAPEFFGSLLMMHAGAMLVSAANEMVFLFVGLELVSIPTYLLLYLARRTSDTQEAATKYFYLSIFSSALLLFGLSYLYGLTGVSNLKALGYLTANGFTAAPLPFATIAVLFVMAGLGFRVAAVPFHFYAPDVYQGSPTVMAAVLAWVPKGVGFLAMIRALTAVLGGVSEVAPKAVLLVWVLAAVTMTLGNTVALLQNDLKRLFAYSSIAHAGYLLIGIAVAFRDAPRDDLVGYAAYLGTQGVLFYLVTYALMTLGAFGVIIALSTPKRPVETVDDLAGLSQTQPAYALAMAVCLFSLAGIPPLAGFWGKFAVFASALTSDQTAGGDMLRWLAVIGVLNSAVGAYYYLRIVMAMYLRQPEVRLTPRTPWPTATAVGVCAALTLIFGLYAQPLQRASRSSAVAAITRPTPSEIPGAVPARVLSSSDYNEPR